VSDPVSRLRAMLDLLLPDVMFEYTGIAEWLRLLQCSAQLRAGAIKYRTLSLPWRYEGVLLLRVGDELTLEEGSTLEDDDVLQFIKLSGRPRTLVFRHLPLLTSRSLSFSNPEQVTIDGCRLLSEWLLEPGQLAQVRRRTHLRIGDLGPCARCGRDERALESMHSIRAVAVCDVCHHLFCWACRETAVDIGGPCAGCGAAVVCVDCMLQVQARGFFTHVKFSLAEKTDKRTSDAGGANMWPALRGLAQSACTERACRERACQERACRERACRERVRGGQGRAHSRQHAHARVRAHMRAQRAPAHTRARARAHARVRTTRARAHTHAHARARAPQPQPQPQPLPSTLYPLPSTLYPLPSTLSPQPLASDSSLSL